MHRHQRTGAARVGLGTLFAGIVLSLTCLCLAPAAQAAAGGARLGHGSRHPSSTTRRPDRSRRRP
jgi:hypothetical protein